MPLFRDFALWKKGKLMCELWKNVFLEERVKLRNFNIFPERRVENVICKVKNAKLRI